MVIKVDIGVNGLYYSYIFLKINNKWTISNDDKISKLLEISFEEYYNRMKKIYTINEKSTDSIYIINPLPREEIVKKFEEEFAVELTLLKLQ